MRIIILTQKENLYLPNCFATVCKALGSDIVCIVSSPAMSTHGGPVRGFIKHLQLFGFRGTWIMGWRIILAKSKAILTKPDSDGPFYSIKQIAASFKVPYYAISRINDHSFSALIAKYQPQLLISISCPQIIGKKIRDRIPLGCINVHGAPLPKYRGLMPAFWVLRNGEVRTATTVHDLGAKLDDGDIILQREVEILPDDTWESLVRRNKAAGAQALIDAVRKIKDGSVIRKPNLEEEATYFSFPTTKDRKAFIQGGRCFF